MDPNRRKSIPLFTDISDDELTEIATFAPETSVGAGGDLVRGGDVSSEPLGRPR